MAHRLELAEDVYQKLQAAAEREGITPAEWVAVTVSRIGETYSPDQKQPAFEALAAYIGVVDSSTHRTGLKHRSQVGDILDKKFARQEISLPEWER